MKRRSSLIRRSKIYNYLQCRCPRGTYFGTLQYLRHKEIEREEEELSVCLDDDDDD
jgi:hypothetical protein